MSDENCVPLLSINGALQPFLSGAPGADVSAGLECVDDKAVLLVEHDPGLELKDSL